MQAAGVGWPVLPSKGSWLKLDHSCFLLPQQLNLSQGGKGIPGSWLQTSHPFPLTGQDPEVCRTHQGQQRGRREPTSRPAQQWLKEGGPASLGWGTGWGACACACACPVTSLARLGPGRAGPGAGRRPSPWGWAALGRAPPWRLACCGPQRCGGRARRGSCPSSWPEPAWSG